MNKSHKRMDIMDHEYHSNNFYIIRTCESDRELFKDVAEMKLYDLR